jgi:hypothetical protein
MRFRRSRRNSLARLLNALFVRRRRGRRVVVFAINIQPDRLSDERSDEAARDETFRRGLPESHVYVD